MELIAVGTFEPGDMSSMGRIYDPQTGQVSNPMSIQQALKWGYWQSPTKSGSKAKRATTGGRWRTLRDGRRVYVTKETEGDS